MLILIKREINYFYLKNPLAIILSLIITLFVLPTSIFPIFSAPIDNNPVISVIYKLLPAMFIVLLGIQSSSMQFYREKVNRNIEVFLAMGYEPIKIWFCKMVSIWIILYLVYLVGLIFSLSILPIITSKTIQPEQCDLYLCLYLWSPLLGLSIIGFNCVVQLVIEDIRVINFSLILFVIFFLMFLPKISKIIPLAELFKHFSVISILVSGLLLLISLAILKLTPREKYLGSG